MGSSLIWNDATVFGWSMGLKILVKDLSEMWKYLESEYATMVVYPLMCWECRDTSLLMRVYNNHCDTVSWSSYFNGSNEFIYIHPRVMKLSTKNRVCDPGTSCWIVR